MKQNTYDFSLHRLLKVDGLIQDHIKNKFDEIEKRNLLRVGPELVWMKEMEDDSKLVLPSHDGSTGIPTWTRYLNDFISGLAVVAGQPNAGKALADYEIVLTPKGWVRISDLLVGDYVYGSQGKPVKVQGVYPQGKKQIVRLHFSDQSYVDCTEDHLWFVQSRTDRQCRKTGSVVTTSELCSNIDKEYILQLPEPIQYEKDVSYDLKVIERTNSLSEDLLTSTVFTRSRLLKDLISSFGTLSKQGKVYFDVKYKKFALEIQDLVRGLGGYATIRECYSHRQSDITFFLPIRYEVDAILPKSFYTNEGVDDRLYKVFVRYEKLGVENATCIKVDAEDSLFITKGYTLTHNTTLLIQFITHLLAYNDDTVVVDFSFDDPAYKRRTQLICNISGLNYQLVGSPQYLDDVQKEKYVKAKDYINHCIDNQSYFLFEASEDFKTADKKTYSGELSTYSQIELAMEAFRNRYPDKKIVFLIDAYNDVSSDGEDYFKLDKVIKSLKHTANSYKIKVMLSAHVKKTSDRNLTPNDIKGSKELEFSTTFAAILRNTWKENAFANPLMLERDGKTYPIITIEPFKNKNSSWTDPWFGAINNYCCSLMPLTRQEYNTVYSQYVSNLK